MEIKKEFETLLEKLKVERDEINLKLHLGSMEAKQEFEEAEKKWTQIKAKGAEIADTTKEASEDFIAKSKIIADELTDAYQRIKQRLSD